jgi:NAD+ synthase (glutamine-hydrolysing)
MKILIAQINPTIGALEGNANKILHAIEQGRQKGADLILFPELVLTGYPPQDLLLLPHFIHEVENQLNKIIEASDNIIVVLGVPRFNPDKKEKPLFNSAAIIQNKQLLGFQDKSLLPTYDVFSERRYFEPGSCYTTWNLKGKKIGITICEDLWQHSALLAETSYRKNPVAELSEKKPDLLLNLSASPFSLSKLQNRLQVCSKAASALHCPVIFCNQVGANDSLIFDGYSLYVNASGQLLQMAKGFEEDFLLIDLQLPSKPINIHHHADEELYQALVLGIKDYFHKSGFARACLGLSGGIDSAVTACLAADALGPQNILGICMPSRYSSLGSGEDARQLAENLGINYEEVSIEKPFQSYLDLLSTPFDGLPADVTEENLQARIRGMILMAFSNKLGYIILSTGNKSELAMGYSTLYGDMCGGLSVLSDVTKQQIYGLARWINRRKKIIPQSSIDKPPSAELRPNQTDQDTLPPYPVVDQVLQAYVENHLSPDEIAKKYDYPLELVNDLIRRIHRNEYKRSQAPPGLRVSEKAFTVGRRFPIVERWV